jgi:hypothetical protein
MRKLLQVLALLFAGLPVLFLAPRYAAAVPCAFLDANDDGIFNAGDTLLNDSEWIGHKLMATVPFVVPVGCPTSGVLAKIPAPFPGVEVIAPKITFLGQLHILKPGGRGVVLWADPAVSGFSGTPGVGDDGSITIGNGAVEAQLEAGGASLLFDANTTPAVFRRSISLLAAGKCTINKATIRGFAPTADTDIGIDCHDDILIRATTIIASQINIQSITGDVDAYSGIPVEVPSHFTAFNNPLLMIAQKDLDMSGATLSGRYRVTLASVEGNVVTQNTQVDHGAGSPPGGAKIFVFAHPTSVTRLPNDREDFVGPSSGTIDITNACYESPNKIVLGTGATVIGAPAGPPCAQFPVGFVFKVSAFF